MKRIRVPVKLLEGAEMPRRRTKGAAGYDLVANENRSVPGHGFTLVGTGIVLDLPDGLEAQVRPRSGLAARYGIGILNSPGTIDSDYRGEIRIILFNVSGTMYRIRKGDRVAQLVFSRAVPVRLEQAKCLSRTARGSRGFGSTG